jgi:hypothetical protein
MMFLLMSSGTQSIYNALVLNTLEDVQTHLKSVTTKWDRYSICPMVFYLRPDQNPEEFTYTEYNEFIYPYTYNTRSKQCVEPQ